MVSALAAIAVSSSLSLHAAVLDWNAVDWTARWNTGTPNNPVSQTFTNVDGSGVDITISIQRGPSTGATEVSNATTTPDDTSTPISHNYDPTDEALRVDVNFDDRTVD
jgi:hypothetical protein